MDQEVETPLDELEVADEDDQVEEAKLGDAGNTIVGCTTGS